MIDAVKFPPRWFGDHISRSPSAMGEHSKHEGDIKDLAQAMVRFHGAEPAVDLARRYSERRKILEDPASRQKWSAVAAFLKEMLPYKPHFSAIDNDV